jgi:hypothetical protein
MRDPPAIKPPRRATSLHCIRLLNEQRCVMRGILLWAVGIPIPIIILLYLFHVI